MTCKRNRFTVVIPTKNRSTTLYSSLKTVVDQNFDNLQILVSDNFSTDDTESVVKSFRDPRVHYIRTEKKLGMSGNWEFALEHVNGDYVFFLGDDDGLMPDACENICSLLNQFNMDCVTWNKPNYNWPDAPVFPGYLGVELGQDVCLYRGPLMRSLVAMALVGYTKLPSIYNSFVSMSAVRSLKGKSPNGRFFNSVTPDVYSGIILAGHFEKYLYSFRPFSVNGRSGRSNGLSIYKNDSSYRDFFHENEIFTSVDIPVLPGSINSAVAEAYLQAYALNLTNRFPLLKRRYLKAIIRDLLGCEISLRHAGLAELAQRFDNALVKNVIHLESSKQKKEIEDGESRTFALSPKGYYERLDIMDSRPLGIENILQCVEFLRIIFGDYKIPRVIRRYPILRAIARRLFKLSR